MKTALIKGQSRYGALRHFVDVVAEAIEARGDEAVVLDLTTFRTDELGERLEAAGPLDLVLTFNILGNYRDPKGHTIFEITGAPHVTQLVDHPLHHMERLKSTPFEAGILVVDHSHQRAINTLFGPGRFAHVGFCPHGALGYPAAMPADAHAYAAERPIEVLFCGTCYRPAPSQIDELPDQVKTIVTTAIEAASDRDWVPALDAFDTALRAFGIPLDAPHLGPEEREGIVALRSLAYIADDWVRSARRMRLLEQAVRSGLALTIAGEGFEAFARQPNVDVRGPVATAEIPALMRQSRIVLNANANFGEGSHERTLTAMLAGAVTVTDTSTFYDTEFKDGAEIIEFRWSALDATLARIKALAADQDALFEIAKAGQAAVAAGHRWQHRIDHYYAAGRAAAAASR